MVWNFGLLQSNIVSLGRPLHNGVWNSVNLFCRTISFPFPLNFGGLVFNKKGLMTLFSNYSSQLTEFWLRIYSNILPEFS